MSDQARALEGLRVLDQTQVMAGPFCAMLLADMGADVIKIEPPGGETTRTMDLEAAPGVSAPFLAVNRNKRGLVLDLKRVEGVAILTQLVATADVLIENYRPGVARRLGVDYATLSAVNPRLVYCSISGFGQTGPYAERGGYDLIAQGMSGIMSATGSEGGAPVKVGVPITDLGAGLFAVFGILCAVRARRVTGRGQFVDTSLFEAGLALSAWEATEYWYTGQVPRGLGTAHRLNAPYQAFRASDGYFTVGAANDNLFPAGPINTVPEALDDPHVHARGMVQELAHPDAGRVKGLGNPVKLSATPPAMRKAAPRLGEDTDAILAELGLDPPAIAALRAKGVVA